MVIPTQNSIITDTTSCSDLGKTLFQEPWWLDAVTEGNWAEASHTTKYGTVKFAYGIRKRYGILTEIYLPPLSPYIGIHHELAKPITQKQQYNMLEEAIPQLLKQLPKYSRLKLNLMPEFSWWSPFYWNGFHQHTRYTYILQNIKNHDSRWSEFSTNTKRNVKKAQKGIEVTYQNGPDVLYSLFSKTMNNQEQKPGYDLPILKSICELITLNGTGKILSGIDRSGEPHCALLLVWDNKSAYYLVGGTDPALRSSGAMSLTMWQAIKEASVVSDKFDFEGSMQQGIDKFLRGFGATAVPYYSIGHGIQAHKIS